MSRLINVYGGPGSGKTTTAAAIFAHLKQTGRHAELCLEYAKELVYAGELYDTPEHQIMAEQCRRHRVYLKGGVDYVVTDAPLFHKASFSPYGEEFMDMLARARATEGRYERVLHIMLPEPGPSCSMKGRVHTPEQGRQLHQKTRRTLEQEGIMPWYARGVPDALEAVFNFITGEA